MKAQVRKKYELLYHRDLKHKKERNAKVSGDTGIC